MAKKLWSMSTTVRNPNRVKDFLSTLQELNGCTWDEETQIKFQVLLIKNKLYKPTTKELPENLVKVLTNPLGEISYEEAYKIFSLKNYVGTAMRGRNSFSPLKKMGVANITNGKVTITDTGFKLLSGEIAVEDFAFMSLLKWQYPNCTSSDFLSRDGYNTKPFVATLHLIKRVNELCEAAGEKPKGISKEEFGIFALSLIHYRDVDKWARALLDYRRKKATLTHHSDKTDFMLNTISEFLSEFENANESNCRDYADNAIRYFRITRYVYIRGGGFYIDLEPRRALELGRLLSSDNGAAKEFKGTGYIDYLADYNSYKLPWRDIAELKSIANAVMAEIQDLQGILGLPTTTLETKQTATELEHQIKQLREMRTALQNLKIKRDYSDVEKIDEAIYALMNIRKSTEKTSIALEKWANIALNIINDSMLIKPNYPVGDDNEPTFTAPANIPDIECFYDGFAAICEVTMLTGRNQWYNEGQPVQRHLRDFETMHDEAPSYCLFIAPAIHRDTLNTFWNAVKYEYEGKQQKIIPMRIDQLVLLLEKIKTLKMQGRKYVKEDLRGLYEKAVDVSNLTDSGAWLEHISKAI